MYLSEEALQAEDDNHEEKSKERHVHVALQNGNTSASGKTTSKATDLVSEQAQLDAQLGHASVLVFVLLLQNTPKINTQHAPRQKATTQTSSKWLIVRTASRKRSNSKAVVIL